MQSSKKISLHHSVFRTASDRAYQVNSTKGTPESQPRPTLLAIALSEGDSFPPTPPFLMISGVKQAHI